MRRRPRAPPRLARSSLWAARWDPAEQDGASYFGTARRERRHRPAAAVHAERRVNQVRQRARLSSPYTATNQVPLVAPSRRPPPPCSCSCRCTHLHGRFLASGGGWYSTDCREKRGQEKINPPSIRQATHKPGACSILILFIITGNKRKHQYQQQSYRSPSVTVYVYMYIHIYIKRR